MKSIHQFAIRLTVLALFVSLGGCLKETASTVADQTPNTGGSTNTPPSISGNPPAAVKVGESYSFTPQASDPDGDALTFSIENKPVWANFDNNTGQVSGIPTLGDIGIYSNIRISVSDGQDSAAMTGFTVEVTQVATASTTLSWTAPTQNVDGSTLTDLAGFKIYFGRSSGNYTNEIRVDNPSVTTYVVDNLSPDTYYFAATAFNAAGFESGFSGEAIKTVN